MDYKLKIENKRTRVLLNSRHGIIDSTQCMLMDYTDTDTWRDIRDRSADLHHNKNHNMTENLQWQLHYCIASLYQFLTFGIGWLFTFGCFTDKMEPYSLRLHECSFAEWSGAVLCTIAIFTIS